MANYKFIKDIPEEIQNDILSLSCDSTGCEMIRDILECYYSEPWEPGQFFVIDSLEEVPELALLVACEMF